LWLQTTLVSSPSYAVAKLELNNGHTWNKGGVIGYQLTVKVTFRSVFVQFGEDKSRRSISALASSQVNELNFNSDGRPSFVTKNETLTEAMLSPRWRGFAIRARAMR